MRASVRVFVFEFVFSKGRDPRARRAGAHRERDTRRLPRMPAVRSRHESLSARGIAAACVVSIVDATGSRY
ncbi:hypothetical protein BURMUCF1_A0412 [Burkholderia multivorans ATCC BAA-247]|nr:hypothetical protein BURMUCF1_A0412 [Burkholderia multivorans ATCC BAA-247]